MEEINKKPAILIHSIVFSPDGVSTAYLYNDLALGFKENGFDVIVLTSTPHYNILDEEIKKQPLEKKGFGLYFESNFNGIRVIHVPLKKYKSSLIRILSFIYWHIFSLIIGLSIRRINYIISPSPPLSIALVSNFIAKLKKAESIYNVQEIYPDLLIHQGIIKSKWLIFLLKQIEKLVYNSSSAVTTIDTAFYDKIEKRIKNKDKLLYIPNFVDSDLYKPILNSYKNLPQNFGYDNSKFIIAYAGNIGYYQEWEPVFIAAKKLEHLNLEFWIIGEGVMKTSLEQRIKSEKLANIKVYPYVKRALIPFVINAAHIHLISIKKELADEGFPSKIYTIMACAKPLIVLSGSKSPLYKFLEGKNCAILISENLGLGLAEKLEEIYNDKDLLEIMGRNGFNYIKDNYSKQVVIRSYIQLLTKL